MIVGHQRQIQLLDLHIRTGMLPHAYLFTGPRQVGKMTIARSAAASVLCLKRPRGILASCGTCQSCVALSGRAHPDVFDLSIGGGDARNAPLRIGDIRDLCVRAGQSAYAGKKLFFVDDISHSTREAANALLKVLEEPRGDTIFFLIAQQAEDVLPTIRSRAWQMRFWPVSYELLETCLVENYRIPPASASSAASLAYGRPGMALELCSLPPEILKKKAIEHADHRTILFGSAAERLQSVDALYDDPERMELWYNEHIAALGSAVHTMLEEESSHVVHTAALCRHLVEGQQRFKKPYAAKRVIFEADVLHPY